MLLGAVVALVGCAAVKPKTPEEEVIERANARWAALVAGDFAKAYTYLTPSYRKVVSSKVYAGSFGTAAKPISAEVVRAACYVEECDLGVSVDLEIALPYKGLQRLSSGREERWVREDGQWYYYQQF